METWSIHQLYIKAEQKLGEDKAVQIRSYAQHLSNSNFPVIFSLAHLSKITGVNYKLLRSTVERRRESANYRMFAVHKRSGGRRFIHAVTNDLLIVQKYINENILQRIKPHPASFAFHPSGGIKKCADKHRRARWLFHFDLLNFFHAINEADVYSVFEDMGYRPLLAFELTRICTTTFLPRHLNSLLYKNTRGRNNYKFYFDQSNASGVLPQGAPTSPMLSNLAARKLDILLTDYADKNGFVYTRYADDITISAMNLPKAVSIGDINRSVINIISRCRFKENKNKRHVAGPGSKKLVLGLLVDGATPRISRETYKRIDRHLYASIKFSLEATAEHNGFDSAFGFYNHLSGLISYVKDVDYDRWEIFKEKFDLIDVPWEI